MCETCKKHVKEVPKEYPHPNSPPNIVPAKEGDKK